MSQYQVKKLRDGGLQLSFPNNKTRIPASIALRKLVVSPVTGRPIAYRPDLQSRTSQWAFKKLWTSGKYYLTSDYKLKRKLQIASTSKPAPTSKPEAVLFYSRNTGIIQAFQMDNMTDGNYHKDYEVYFEKMRSEFIRVCGEIGDDMNQFRVGIVIEVEYRRVENNKTMLVNAHFSTKLTPLLRADDADNLFTQFAARLIELIIQYENKGSNWIFHQILRCNIQIARYRPVKGGSYIPTPAFWVPRFKQMRITNIRNKKDDECFRRAVINHFYLPKSHDPNRPNQYDAIEHDIDFSMLTYPVDLHQIPRFEKANKIGVYCHLIDGKTVRPIYPENFRTNFNKYERVIDLVILQDGVRKRHFCPVNGPIHSLYSNQYRNSKSRSAAYFCRCCCTMKTTKAAYENHIAYCHQHKSQLVQLPSVKQYPIPNSVVTRMRKLDVTIYADFEAIMKEVNQQKGQKTKLDSEHVMSGWGFQVVSDSHPELCRYYSRRGEGCGESFLDELNQAGDQIYAALQKYRNTLILSNREQQQHDEAVECYLCGGLFGEKPSELKVRDHSHSTGEYLGAAHSKCNLYDATCCKIPVFFHNLKGYDCHFIFQTLRRYLQNKKNPNLFLIPNSMEKIMCLSIKHLRTPLTFTFKDSLNFLSAGLAKLVKNMRDGNEDLVGFNNMKMHYNDKEMRLLTQKGVYFYEAANSFEQFDETSLPSRDEFYSSLTRKTISRDEYEFAQRVWSETGCKTRWDYHDLYLKTDVLLLADVFENFRTLSLKLYGLDPAHYVSLPSLSWDALRLTTKAYVESKGGMELMTDPDMYMMVEGMIRGGISMIVNRRATANNKYMKNYDPQQPSSFIRYLDMNNLYGWSMSQRLPLNNFRWATNDEITSFDVTTLPDDGDQGAILEVDVSYPDELHDLHNDLPLLPERVRVNAKDKSAYTTYLEEMLSIKCGKTDKLIPHLGKRTKYVLHYRNLKQALSLGLKLEKVHRIIFFDQYAWMKPYIDLNTRERAKAKNDFEKDFFKLMNNSVFGKTMENVRKHFDVKLLRADHNDDEHKLQMWLNDLTVQFPIDYDGMLAFKQNKKKVMLDKPILVGASILDLSKVAMYDFHYNYMLKKYGPDQVKLQFTDTDSLCYSIQTDDWFDDIKGDVDRFDFSNYPPDHKIFSNANKKVVGKMKDEVPGVEIADWAGLKAKMYSLKLDSELRISPTKSITEKHTSKGVPDSARTLDGDKLCHEHYVSVIENEVQVPVSLNSIRSFDHHLFTVSSTKSGLSPHDDKRFLLDKYSSLSYGHYKTLT
jgi:hypothetical protein